MKHFSLFIVFILLFSVLSGCAYPPASGAGISPSQIPESEENVLIPPKKTVSVGIVECPWVLNISAVDSAIAESQFVAIDPSVSVISCFAANETELLSSVEKLLLDGAETIIVSLPTSSSAEKVIALCKPKGVPVILTGAKPSETAMNSYDKCWYIEMLCEQTGELLGKAVAKDFKEGIIPDANADELLQYAWFGGDENGGKLHYKYSLQSCADMGVFSNEIFSQLTACGEEAGYAMAQNLLGMSLITSDLSGEITEETVDTAPTSYPTPEAVLCSDSATARGAAPLLKEAGIYVACVAVSENDAKALESEGIYTPTWFARDEVTHYAVCFANNLLNGKHVTLDTDLYLDETRQTLVSAGTNKKS